jgi:hypothetical protein
VEIVVNEHRKYSLNFFPKIQKSHLKLSSHLHVSIAAMLKRPVSRDALSLPGLLRCGRLCLPADLSAGRNFSAVVLSIDTLYQERAVFGKMKMDPAKRAQTQNTGEVSLLERSFPNPLN